MYMYVPVPEEDFGRAVFKSATKGVEQLAWLHVRGTAKVYQLHVELAVHDYVLILLSTTTTIRENLLLVTVK